MYDPAHEIQTEYMGVEDGSQYGENSHLKRFIQEYKSPAARRQKVKCSHFFSISQNDKLSLMLPPSRNCLDNSTRIRTISPHSLFSQSHDKPSFNNFKDQETDPYLMTMPSQYVSTTPDSSKGYSMRIRPKKIPQEKEKLYDEILGLKNIIHALKDENLKLKTRINSLEQEGVKLEKVLANQGAFIVERDIGIKSTETHFVLTLKNQIKELKNLLYTREVELAEINKSVKYTKIQEQELQLKVFSDEAKRLKGVLQQVIKERTQNLARDNDISKLQEECFLQTSQIKTMQRVNNEFKMAIKEYKQRERKYLEEEKKYRVEIEKYKKALLEKEKENLKLYNELNGISSNSARSQNLSIRRGMTATKEELLGELEAKKKEIAGLSEQLTDKETQIQNLEKQVKDLNRTANTPTILQNGEKFSLLTESGKRKIFAELHAELKGNPEEAKMIEATLGFQQFLTQMDSESIQASPKEGNISPERTKHKSDTRGKVQKVRIEDIKDLGYEINLFFRIKDINFDDLFSTLWSEKVLETSTISIKEMSQLVKKEPFNVRTNQDSILIARYLIENSEEEYIHYNEGLEGDIASIEEKLKELIGTVLQWGVESAREIHESIAETFIEHHVSLRENLRALCKGRYLTRGVFQDVCGLVDIFLTEEQVEFIVTKLFEQAKNIHKLKIDNLFEIFAAKPKEPEAIKKSNRESRRSSDLSNKSEAPDFVMRRSSRSFTASELMPMARHFIRESELEDEEENSPVKRRNYNTKTDVSDPDNPEVKGMKARDKKLPLAFIQTKSPIHIPLGEEKNEKNEETGERRTFTAEANDTSENERDQTQDMRELEPKFYADSPANGKIQIFSTLEMSSDKDVGQYERESEYCDDDDNNTREHNNSQDDKASESIDSGSSRRRGLPRTHPISITQYPENKSSFYKTDKRKSGSLYLEERKDVLSEQVLQLNAISEREETIEERSARLERDSHKKMTFTTQGSPKSGNLLKISQASSPELESGSNEDKLSEREGDN